MKPGKPLGRGKAMKAGSPQKRRTRVNPINRKRREKEWARAYHSRERRDWVKTRECKVQGCRRKAVNMHIKTGGTGRKADYTEIADICQTHHLESHRGQKTFELKYKLALRQIADQLDADWERYLMEKELKAAA